METAVIHKSVYYWFTKRELITCFVLENNLSLLQMKLEQRGLPSDSPVDLALFGSGN